jgi:PAS domain S-box-containing protein
MGLKNLAADFKQAADEFAQLDLERLHPNWKKIASRLKPVAEAIERAAVPREPILSVVDYVDGTSACVISNVAGYMALLLEGMQTGMGWNGKGIFTGWWNTQKICTLQNDIFCDYLGLTRERACTEWPDYVHAEDRPHVERKFEIGFRERCLFQSCYRLLHRDGDYRWIHEVVLPYNERDNFAGYVGIGVEVPEALKAV